ncbi:TPA: fimbrial protein [Escherichia coli]|uniref:fimbrial protein n=2 Tax=Enterobacteriaceae TaxID=543 RepID=UPI001558A7BE|nr:fimbrial protein [Escherichia coli]MDM1620475.1 fimbrial protein [Escherichia coli]HBB9723016.1 fimbrial protein [Escherichia coli]HCP8417009.1 fimbrial protein [Escherichia coli]HCY2221447.1 fimbrial protein [Escherichia coli]HCY2508349.1 fimbrial protein [Escherichia coli]
MMSMLRKFIFLFVLFTFVNSVRAIDVPVRIYGTIIIPPCEINSGEPVNVDFGNVQEEKINSRTYDKKIIVPVRCPYHQGDVSLTITAASIIENADVVATDIEGLGILLYEEGNNKPLSLNNAATISTGLRGKGEEYSNFTFIASLYKYGKNKLKKGVFRATVMIDIYYI